MIGSEVTAHKDAVLRPSIGGLSGAATRSLSGTNAEPML